MGKVIEQDSKQFALATEMAMFMARNLRNVGIDVVVTTDEHARKALENEKGDAEFSMRDIMNLSYTWNGEEVSMRGFAEQFMSEIKQKDRTMEDAERIARTFIEAVKADPEKAGMKMLKAENMANAFRFKLPDGTIYTPEHPMAESPEYQTQKGLWEIYEHVLGKETMREFIGLLSKNAPMSSEEIRRYSELESRVNGSDVMQRLLEIPASKVNENRVKDIRNLIQYFEGNDDYTWTEKALIIKGAMSFGYSEKKEADSTRVEIKKISDNNSVSVPVIGGEAAAVVEGLRKGLNFKDALVQARIMLSKESKRSIESNFTGWKVYKQSDKEEDAVILNQDVAGTGWCTGGAVSTARNHLSGGDFHVYYEAGEPLIAIRTVDGRMAEPPRGAHEGQFCKPREEQIAFDYVRSGNGIIAGDDYIADIEDIRRVMSPNATPLDAFMMPEERRYENGEFGDDTKAWGKSVEQRIAELVPDKEERWKLGLYYGNEIEDACKNGNAIIIKGCIEFFDSTSLTLPEGVTRVGNIYLYDSASLTFPAGLTQVGHIKLSGSNSLTFPDGVKHVGDIELIDSASLTLPDGVKQVGYIELRDSASLTLPEGVKQAGDIKLCESASLTLPEGVKQAGDIELFDSASLTLPEGVTRVGNIYLYDSASLTLPEGVTRVGYIYLYDSTSLTLPAGLTQVGHIKLSGSTSLTFPEGVKHVGDIELYGSSSLTLPEGVTQVGNIYLKGSASLTLPEGVTQVGKIVLYDSTSLTLPEGVTQVGRLMLGPDASITFPDGFMLKADYGLTKIDAEEMNHLLSEHQRKQEFRLADGTIYGYQQGDTIYLTSAGINPNTPIHEYAHLWAKVYEKIQPDQWEAMKAELKGLPLWEEIASSRDYQHLSGDENRLAGEVLATVVGNKGEELLLEHAGQLINETGNPVAIKDAVQSFREKLTRIAVKDVFKVEGMEHVGAVTLKVLKDFAEGEGNQLVQEQEQNLSKMVKYVPERSINNVRQGKSSTLRTSLPDENVPRFVKSGANVRTFDEVSKYINSLCEQIGNGRIIGEHEFLFELALSLGFPENVRGGNVSLYFDIAGKDSLRLSNHYGHAIYFKQHEHESNNYGIVIKMTSSRFLPHPNAEYIENVYYPDKLNPERQKEILRGLEEFVKSGDFSKMPVPDRQNVSRIQPEHSLALANNNLHTRVEFSTSYNNKHSQYDKDKLNMITNTKINTECGYTVAKVSDHIHNFSEIKQQLKKTPSVLIYNNNELFYSGPMAEEFKHQFARDIKVGLAYYGQDPASGMGYFGYKEGALPKEEINAVLANLENKMIVKHELLEEKNRKENASVENTRKISEGEATAPARELTREERRQKLQEKARENNQKMLDRVFSGKSTNKKSTEVKQKK